MPGRLEEKSTMITVHGKQLTAAFLLALISMLVGLACTSVPRVRPSGGGPESVDACFDVSRVRSFSPLDGRSVYVRVGSDEHFLLTMDSYYPSLPFATGITISGIFSRVCSDTGARITYLDSGSPVFGRIVRVEAVASREAARKRVEDRTNPKPKG
jgi:Family of unknown function (DUF6491)